MNGLAHQVSLDPSNVVDLPMYHSDCVVIVCTPSLPHFPTLCGKCLHELIFLSYGTGKHVTQFHNLKVWPCDLLSYQWSSTLMCCYRLVCHQRSTLPQTMAQCWHSEECLLLSSISVWHLTPINSSMLSPPMPWLHTLRHAVCMLAGGGSRHTVCSSIAYTGTMGLVPFWL